MKVIVDEEFILAHRDDPIYHEIIYNQYEKFIHQIAHKYYINGYEHEDLASEGTLKFFQLLKYWNPERECKFTTFLGIALDNHFKMLLRYETRPKRCSDKPVLSIDTPLSSSDSDLDKLSLKDLIKDEDSLRSFNLEPNALELIEGYCNKLTNQRTISILKMYFLDDVKQKDIANIVGLSQAQVSRSIKKHSKRLKTLYERGNY